MSERHDTRIYDEAHAKGFAEGWAKALRGSTVSGIPWRFDLENMPKDKTRFLAFVTETEGAKPKLIYYTRSAFYVDNSMYDLDKDQIVAWCPIDAPLPPVEQTHPSSNGDAE